MPRASVNSLALTAAFLFGCGTEAPAGEPIVRLNAAPESPHFGTVEAANLEPSLVADLERRRPSAEDWRTIFPVYTGSEIPSAESGKPPVAGSYVIDDRSIRFRPRYPLVAGLTYSARLDLGPSPIVASFALPEDETPPSTLVTAVYPTADELPENLLRLYVHFSAAMSRGEAYDRIHVVDAAGAEVTAPFVEIEQELWDPRVRRLTLLFDPGRIKRGLRPHEEVGPPLAAGGTYRLVIDADWRDAKGLPLKEGFEKRFTVVDADRTSPDPAEWRIEAPTAGSREPLVLRLPESLDHGLLERVLAVRDGGGQVLGGDVEIGDEEKRWAFTPAESWSSGDYEIVVETILEDVAGNNLRHVFDVDLSEASDRAVDEDRISLPFRVGPGS